MDLCGGQLATDFCLNNLEVGNLHQGVGIRPFGASIILFPLVIDRIVYPCNAVVPIAWTPCASTARRQGLAGISHATCRSTSSRRFSMMNSCRSGVFLPM